MEKIFYIRVVGIIIAILTLTNKDESHNENNEMNEFPKDHHLDSNEIKTINLILKLIQIIRI